MSGVWSGTVSEIFDTHSLTGYVEQQQSERFEKFPLLELFEAERETYDSERVEYEIVKHIRKLGKLHAAPSPGDRAAYEQFGKRAAQVFYQSETFNVPSEHIVALRYPGESEDASHYVANAQARAARHITRKLNAPKHSLQQQW